MKRLRAACGLVLRLLGGRQLRDDLASAQQALRLAQQMHDARRAYAFTPTPKPPPSSPSGFRPCRACGQPMPWGVAHYCPERRPA